MDLEGQLKRSSSIPIEAQRDCSDADVPMKDKLGVFRDTA